MADSTTGETAENISGEGAGYQTVGGDDESGVQTVFAALAWGGTVLVSSPVAVATAVLAAIVVVYGTLWLPGPVEIAGLFDLVVRIIAASVLVQIGQSRFLSDERSRREIVGDALARTPHLAGLGVAVGLATMAVVGVSTLLSIALGQLSLVVLVPALTYLGLRTALAVPAIVVEGVDTLDGIALGWAGSRRETLAVLLILAVALVDSLVRAFVLPVESLPALGVNVVLTAVVFGITTLAFTRLWLTVREAYVDKQG